MIKSIRRTLGIKVLKAAGGSSTTANHCARDEFLFSRKHVLPICPFPSMVWRIQGQGKCIVANVQ